MFSELAKKCRTSRSFEREQAPTREQLRGFVDIARISASAGNLQRIRYSIIEGEAAKEMFSYIGLGGLLKPEDKPTVNEAAPSYIVLLIPDDKTDTNLYIDVGICAEVIMLAAAEKGFSGCMIRNFKTDGVRSLAGAEKFSPALVIAIGKSRERAVLVDVNEGDSLKYYRENGNHVVPKLSLDSVIK